jgi:hypothetical protein
MKIKPCRATPLLYQLSNADIVTFVLIFRERLQNKKQKISESTGLDVF